MPRLSKGKRISGDHRAQVRTDFVARYQSGESIRSIATESGRSYGFVQGLLKDAGVEFRSRGGARTPKKVAQADADEEADTDADGLRPAGRAPRPKGPRGSEKSQPPDDD